MKVPDDRRDLAPLDPRSDPRRWESMVQGINRAAAFEIARRAALPEPGVLFFLSEWRRPAAAACTAIAAGSAAILLLQSPATTEADTGIAAALGFAEPVATWIETGSTPSVEELLISWEGADR